MTTIGHADSFCGSVLCGVPCRAGAHAPARPRGQRTASARHFPARAFWHSNRREAPASGQCSPYLRAVITDFAGW
ncbi:hypothetical protein ACS15_3469 [Ralstonia insidiosa]|uniref:Uncharacterized protein n=1 Tax=Ralstonia insidiosa TaxID=190721 RepID=A0AAC9BL42_9RALS|nr:hypothetical protein ACS15_3469 [Ralstonia insidiosa]